jgi:LysM repeat protein
MNTKKHIQILIVIALLAATFVSTGSVKASYPCPTYYTVQWGDTLSGIAAYCGTTVYAIRAANPGLGWWVYAGQVIYIPTGTTPPPQPPPSYATYVVMPGDTLGKIAARAGTTVYAILAVNPQITNPNLIYVGQVIYMPPGVAAPPPPSYPPLPTYPTTPPTYPTVPPTYPTATPSTQYAYLWVDYEHGLYIRDMPNGNIIASALDGQQLTYRTDSVFQDSNWKVWVEVKLYPPTKGYYVGWLMVRDQMGTYYTNPRIAADP